MKSVISHGNISTNHGFKFYDCISQLNVQMSNNFSNINLTITPHHHVLKIIHKGHKYT